MKYLITGLLLLSHFFLLHATPPDNAKMDSVLSGNFASCKNEFEAGRIENASSLALELLPDLKKHRHFKEAEKCCLWIVENYKAQENLEKALTYTRLAAQYKDSLFSLESSKSISELKNNNEIKRNEERIKELALQRTLKDEEMARQRNHRNILVVGLIMLGAFVVILYQIKKQKERLNVLLKQKHEEAEAQRAQILAQTQRLEQMNLTKDKLFSTISRDIRTPIDGLKNILTLFYKDKLPPEKLMDMAPQFRQSVNEVSETVDNVLKWSLLQMKEVEARLGWVFLLDLVEEIFDVYVLQMKSHKLELKNENDANWEVEADRQHLQVILRNLISNAIKFTPDGGEIRLYVAEMGNEAIRICIKDSGMGISPEKKKNLFQIENLSNENANGAGIGLALAKAFVEKNDGKIGVESEEGKGATFWVEIKGRKL
jgi:signal transduction histidine kinase